MVGRFLDIELDAWCIGHRHSNLPKHSPALIAQMKHDGLFLKPYHH